MKEDDSPFYILTRAHDHIWKDKAGWMLKERMDACKVLWDRAIRLGEPDGSGGAKLKPDTDDLRTGLLRRRSG